MQISIQLVFTVLTMVSLGLVIYKVAQENQKQYVPIKIKVKKRNKPS